MFSQRPFLSLALMAAIAAATTLPAAAQTSGPATQPQAQMSGSSNSGWMSTGKGYMGLNLGRSHYNAPCGNGVFGCDRNDSAAYLYGGSMMSPNWGVEVGYLDMGRMSRGNGTTRARGLNLSVVAKAPVGQAFAVFGKLGATYGRTDTSAAIGSGVTAGNESGFGVSYGLGASYDFTPNLAGVVGWDSHDFRFAGSGRDTVRMTSVGLQYKF